MQGRRIVLGIALILGAACGSKTRVTGTVTNKVTAIDLGRSINSDRTIKDKSDTFQPSDTIYASVETETLGSATIKARWTFETGQLVNESTQLIPTSGGSLHTEFHVAKPDGWPVGKYRLEVNLDKSVAGIKEFTVK